jgi:hypothetical protein
MGSASVDENDVGDVSQPLIQRFPWAIRPAGTANKK